MRRRGIAILRHLVNIMKVSRGAIVLRLISILRRRGRLRMLDFAMCCELCLGLMGILLGDVNIDVLVSMLKVKNT
jgi:hypothetical protein